jgi:hypothetical protein
MKKQTVEQQIEIDWPIRALFNYVCDIHNNATWQAEVDHAEWTAIDHYCTGARYTCLQPGRTRPATYEVTEHTPYQRRSVTRRDAWLQPTYNMEFESRGERTLLRVSVSFNAPWSLMAPWYAGKLLAAYDLSRLKQILETEN